MFSRGVDEKQIPDSCGWNTSPHHLISITVFYSGLNISRVEFCIWFSLDHLFPVRAKNIEFILVTEDDTLLVTQIAPNILLCKL